MEIIKPNVEIIMEPDNLKRIEIAGRTCYKSESQITADSAKKFYQNLIRRGHTSVLEHSNLICTPVHVDHDYIGGMISCMKDQQLLNHDVNSDLPIYIRTSGLLYSGNLRSWRNMIKILVSSPFSIPYKRHDSKVYTCALFGHMPEFADLFENIDDATKADATDLRNQGIVVVSGVQSDDPIHNIITARFTCSRAMSHELVRHRLMGISQESQRYVKYGELTVIEPHWWENLEYPKYEVARTVFLKSNLEAEHNYSAYIDAGLPPQSARGALTNDTKTEVVLTGTIPAWKRFLDLRDSSAAHPDIQILAKLFRERVYAIPELQKWGL